VGSVIIGLLILALFVSCLVAMFCDVIDACHQAQLDELWEDDAPASWTAEV
jgi:hypothetical protein